MSKDRNQRQSAPKDKDSSLRGRDSGSECPVIVVGVGVSAGRLTSLKQLFAKMPTGHGVAFILIQHPDPSHKSLTVGRLKVHTALAVVEATDGMPVLADRIHLVPPEKSLNINGCRLTLQELVECNGLWMPIDHFFCSLAADQRQRGCGVVLSGAGRDGTIGLSEIRASGGRTFAEEPASAEIPDMPRSAMEAGVVETVLPAKTMAGAIIAMAKQVAEDTRNEPVESPEFDAHLRSILDILRLKAGYDFRCYKPNTLVRRIRRRMTLAKTLTFADYVLFLNDHPDEIGLLQKDLLIGVTDFFRQPQAWETLEEKVITELVKNAQPGSEIRIWVPGCSTGKEAYGLAMLLSEQVEKSGKKVSLQIFATDSDVAVLAAARSGIYAEEEIGESISPDRLKRFFSRKDGACQIDKRIRELIVFAPQNLTADPPFSRLDLISCRNLLIYLDQEVQKKIIALFHFSLREGGYLFLGNAESIGDREDLFEPVSKKWRIYRRIGVGRPVGVEIPVRPGGETSPAAGKPLVAVTAPRTSLTSAAQQMLLDRFAPACVIIDRKLQVLYVHGAVEDYLTFPAGELTTRVVDMAREGLRARLRGAIGKCLEIKKTVSVTARVRRGSTGGGEKSVPIKATVSPLRYPRETDGLLLITLEDYRVSAARLRRKADVASDVHQLEDELKVTREELQSTIEQLEVSNDQLKASNEEVIAANEELQSANEEMETSKEELQSLNEELNTINNRLQEKVEELEDTNNDVVNLLSSTSIATVFLDKELKVKRYTPASTRLFSLIPSDVGRSIADVLRRFRDEALLNDTAKVLADLMPLSGEVRAEDGRWYIRRITPYRTQDDRIEGVVVTFVDITDRKQAEETVREAHERAVWLARFPEENPNPVMRVSADRNVVYCNPAAAALPGWTCEVDQPVPERLLPTFDRAMALGREAQGEVDLGGRFYSVSVAPIVPESYANIYGRDITDRKRAEEAILQAKEEWERTFDTVPDLIAILDNQHRITRVNRAMAERLGVTPEQCVGLACHETVHGLSQPAAFCPHALTCRDGQQHVAEVHEPRLGGDFLVSTTPLCDAQGQLMGSVHVARDITDRKRAEQALNDNEARFKLLSETAERLLTTADPQGIVDGLCREVMAYLDCQVFFNFLVDEEAGRLRLNAYGGIPEDEARKIEWLDYGAAVCGCVARDRIPVIVENILKTPDPRTDLVKSYGIQAYACHPLKVQDKIIGTLSFGTKTRMNFTLEQLALMRTVTDQVATAMERVRLIGELQRSRDALEIRVRERTAELAQANASLRELSSRILTAHEEERKRIAGDIHDSLGSLLSQTKFMIEGAIRKIGDKAGMETMGPLQSVIPVVQESVNECRRLQMDLRPSMLDDLGILATLSWFCRRFGTTYPGMHLEQRVNAREEEVPDSLKTPIFRIVQEAMNNIAKHSQADFVCLSLSSGGKGIELAIQDNGKGFDAEETLTKGKSKRGLGLESMRERAELSGGTFEIKSITGQGTTIIASWPI
jgi:PAS domain S-box-containing protein